MEIGEKIRELRLQLGLSQADIGELVGITQPAIKKIEAGTTARSRYGEELLRKLEARKAAAEKGEAGPSPADTSGPATRPLPKREDASRLVPVFASVEGGDGALIIDGNPIDWSPRPNQLIDEDDLYGVVIEGTSMMKAYRPGDTVWLHPRYRERHDEPCVFRSFNQETGEARATLKWLNTFNSTTWRVEQFNPPKEFDLSRSEWPECFRVLGKKNRA